MATAVRRGTGIAPSTQAQPRTTAWNSPIDQNNPIFQQSGNDERGRTQNRIVDEQSRYRQQMDPFMDTLKGQFKNAVGADAGDYSNIMNQMGAVGNNPIQARSVSYTDPFQSYSGFQNFANTGGYSDQDMADLRARGMAPVRAAYANAQREVSRGRSLQGGYSPNAAAVQAKMAREQSQGMSDAIQNTNAGIIANRNAGKISGLQGMSGIEGERLNAQLSAGKFNAEAGMQADQWNAGNKLDALSKMGSLYGTTPGRSQLFGNQLGNAIGDSGAMGASYIDAEGRAQQLPGQYENTKQYIGDISGLANAGLNTIEEYRRNRTPSTPPYVGPGTTGTVPQPGNPNIPYYPPRRPALNPNQWDYSDQNYGY